MKSIVLMGPPGSGKTTMYLKTAVRRPLLVIDADRKVSGMDIAKPMITSGDVTVWEVDVPLNEVKLSQRLRDLAENKKPTKPPKGWGRFCQLLEDAEIKPEGKAAKTIVIDSATVVGAHMMRMITYEDDQGRATLSPRDWAYYLMMWQEVTTELRDYCIREDKDLIICVHQRAGEIPGDNVKVTKKVEGGVVNREYIGSMTVKIVPSIQGQFALEMGGHHDEFYGLDVVMVGGVPKWTCRVLPDGRRDLRTSVSAIGPDTPDFEPDFRQIWGYKKPQQTPKK